MFAPPEERDPNFFTTFGRDEKFYKEAKALLDLGETNSNLEMIRLNKKFDIFLKRFMKVEEDIREIRNNFFRVTSLCCKNIRRQANPAPTGTRSARR